MRLDLFLKKTAVIKRRTIAKELVERGHVLINNKIAKPSSNVQDGDSVQLSLGNHVTLIKAVVEIKGTKEIPSFVLVSDTVNSK